MTVINCENTCTPDHPLEINQSSKTPLLASIGCMFKRFFTVMGNRRSVEKLNDASDYELADMGLRREDLYLINNARMFTDPSMELQRRAHKNSCRRKYR